MNRESTLMRAIEKIAKLRVSEIAVCRLEKIAARIGIDENKVIQLYVEAKNSAGRARFAKVPYRDRILLLPQCLRSRECPAKPSEYGYQCVRCGRCRIGLFIGEADALGYKKAMIISGGSIVPKVFAMLKPKGCLGVGCFKELMMGSFVCEKYGIAGQGLPLLKEGCLETELDWGSLGSMLRLHPALAMT